MRSCVRALVLALLVLTAPGVAGAQERVATCRSLAERGKVWAACCAQSYARNPARVITRNARMQQIERCVRNRLRSS